MEEGADFIVGETFGLLDEALLATECIKRYGNGTIIYKSNTYFIHLKILFTNSPAYLFWIT